jgi:glyoxylase-like metal-dependent hydrolase (beta-lactamase superfamily II)
VRFPVSAATLLTALTTVSPAAAQEPLRLSVYVADSSSFHVTSTLIYGATEAILVDAQFRNSEAAKLADLVAATGRHLKAILISHPDDDHYMGLTVLRARFPGTPIYMSAAALSEFKRTSARYLAGARSFQPSETPDSLPTPGLFPSRQLLVDGAAIEVVTDLQGDAFVPSNSLVWVPSLKAVVAGDIVFNGVHVWLANSNQRTRAAWRRSLDRITALHPRVVVAGHKRDAGLDDSPDAVEATRAYLVAFEAAVRDASNADEVVTAMRQGFPDLALAGILNRAARVAVPN